MSYTYICHPRRCISCDTIIKPKGESYEEKLRRGVYKEITLQLSNGSKMRVGVCRVCKEKGGLDGAEMLKAIRVYWMKVIRAQMKPKFERFNEGISVTGLFQEASQPSWE